MKKQNSKHVIPNTKNSRGITLIALIITIIVLLILAIVTFGTVQESGIIGHAESAKNEYAIAQEKENLQLAVSDAILAGKGKITKTNLESALDEIFKDNIEFTDTTSSEAFIQVKIKSSGREYKVYLNGAIEGPLTNSGGGEIPTPPGGQVISSDKDIWQTDGNGTILAFLGTEQSAEVDRLYDELCEDFNSNVEVAKIFGDKQNIVEKWVENTKKSVEIAKQFEDGSYFNNIPNLYPIIESEERTCL